MIRTVAQTLQPVIEAALGDAPPVSVQGWDGSRVNAADPSAPTIVLASSFRRCDR